MVNFSLLRVVVSVRLENGGPLAAVSENFTQVTIRK